MTSQGGEIISYTLTPDAPLLFRSVYAPGEYRIDSMVSVSPKTEQLTGNAVAWAMATRCIEAGVVQVIALYVEWQRPNSLMRITEYEVLGYDDHTNTFRIRLAREVPTTDDLVQVVGAYATAHGVI